MVGIPENLQNRVDWENAFKYALAHESVRSKMKEKLVDLARTGTALVIKKGVTKPAEEQTASDFDVVEDAGSALIRSGFTSAEVASMIVTLEGGV